MTDGDPIQRLNAALEGRYRIERALGVGGMATVYLADDLKHERKVALKVLKPDLAAVVGADRFLAEIKTTANLQHPHILPLFDSGEAENFLFYVMPYVEGESLRERLDREHQLPVDEAVQIARSVAEALSYAHTRGVIHRDIKPANILLQSGKPVISDFGIALAVSAGGRGRLTETGLSLGTPHYMSPEQATGDKHVGPSADIYALGCVLYEMLIGEPPYTGSTPQAILKKIIVGETPSASAQRSTVPANVDSALARALEKLPADRFTSAQDLASALLDPDFRQYEQPGRGLAAGTGSSLTRTLVTIGLVVMLGSLAVSGWLRPSATQPSHATRSVIDVSNLSLGMSDEIIVSPDGSRFAVAATTEGRRSLFSRDAADESFREIPGTENAYGPAFSPDGEWIVYSARTGPVTRGEFAVALLKVAVSGGAPIPLVPPGVFRVPSTPFWGDDGTILFITGSGMYRVPESGGEPERLPWSLDYPSLLPGGRAVIGGAGPDGGIALLDLDTDSVRELVPNGFDAQYVATGHLLFADAAGVVWAVSFDATRGAIEGSPVPILEGVSVFEFGRSSNARFRVSQNGVLVYGAGGGGSSVGSGGKQRLMVMELEGDEELLALEPRSISGPRWSPNGESVAYQGGDPGGSASQNDIFTYDVALGTTPKRLTFTGENARPVWSPDGTRIAFGSARSGSDGPDLYVKDVNGDAPPQLLLSLPGFQLPSHWPSDDLLIFANGRPNDLWMVDPTSGTLAPRPYLEMEADLYDMSVSPQGDMAAYLSNQSGRYEVYMRGFPEGRQPAMVSRGGGDHPRWSADGNTIYYLSGRRAGNRSLIGARIERGPPSTVVTRDTILSSASLGIWDLHPQGDRIIGVRDLENSDALGPERFLLVVNWFEELKRLAPK